MPPRVRGDDVEAAYCGRKEAAVATTAGGGQPRSKTVSSRSTGGGKQVALRARVHHEAKNWLILTDCSNAFNSEVDGYARGGRYLRAGAYTVRGKLLRRDVGARVLLDGIGRKAEDRLL